MKAIDNILQKLEKDGYAEDPASEVLKLEVGEYREIELLDVQPYDQDGKTKHRYTIKDLEDETEKTLFGTVQMDQILTKKEIGDHFILFRIEDKDVGKPNPMAQYKTFSKK